MNAAFKHLNLNSLQQQHRVDWIHNSEIISRNIKNLVIRKF